MTNTTEHNGTQRNTTEHNGTQRNITRRQFLKGLVGLVGLGGLGGLGVVSFLQSCGVDNVEQGDKCDAEYKGEIYGALNDIEIRGINSEGDSDEFCKLFVGNGFVLSGNVNEKYSPYNNIAGDYKVSVSLGFENLEGEFMLLNKDKRKERENVFLKLGKWNIEKGDDFIYRQSIQSLLKTYNINPNDVGAILIDLSLFNKNIETPYSDFNDGKCRQTMIGHRQIKIEKQKDVYCVTSDGMKPDIDQL